jgi:DNA-binding NarL/FixJ family response regulator
VSIRVVIADDQALMRSALRLTLDSQPDIDVVAEAADGREAIDAVTRTQCDVIVLDIRMPLLDGIQATRALRSAAPHTRVLLLTTFDLDDYAFEGLRAGASGFLLKDEPPEEIVRAVRVIASGDALLSSAITRLLLDHVAHRLHADPPSGTSVLDDLTPREREVLMAMARGLSNAEIARAFVLSEATVKSHVARVLMKLGVRDRVQAVIAAYETGLIKASGSS